MLPLEEMQAVNQKAVANWIHRRAKDADDAFGVFGESLCLKTAKGTYPDVNEYYGGGTLLTDCTIVKNVVQACEGMNKWQRARVFFILANGGQVVVQDGQIKAIDIGVK